MNKFKKFMDSPLTWKQIFITSGVATAASILLYLAMFVVDFDRLMIKFDKKLKKLKKR